MPQQAIPGLGVNSYWGAGLNGWKAGVDRNWEILSVIGRRIVKDRSLTVPPGSPVLGDTYIVAAGATGDWAGLDNQIVTRGETAWIAFVPEANWPTFYDQAAGEDVRYNGVSWVIATPVTDAPADGLTYHRQNGTWVPEVVIRNQADFDALVPLTTVDGEPAHHFDDATVYRFVGSGLQVATDSGGAARIGVGNNTVLIGDYAYSATIYATAIIHRGGNYRIENVSVVNISAPAALFQVSASTPLVDGVSFIKNCFLGGPVSTGGVSRCARHEWNAVIGVFQTSAIDVTNTNSVVLVLDSCEQQGTGVFAASAAFFDVTGRDRDVDLRMTGCVSTDGVAGNSFIEADGELNFSGGVVTRCVSSGGDAAYEFILNVDETSDVFNFSGNSADIGNTKVNATLVTNGNTQAVVAVLNTWVPVAYDAGTGLNSGATGFVSPSDGVLIYTRLSPLVGLISLVCGVARVGGGAARSYSVGVAKNQTVISVAGYECQSTVETGAALISDPVGAPAEAPASEWIEGNTTVGSNTVTLPGADFSKIAVGMGIVPNAAFTGDLLIGSINVGLEQVTVVDDIGAAVNASATLSGELFKIGTRFNVVMRSNGHTDNGYMGTHQLQISG